jgi:primary-amine oxidase
MSLSITRLMLIATCSCLFSSVAVAQDHPLDSLSADEYADVFRLLSTVNSVDETTIYNSIELKQPAKSFVTQWSPGVSFPRVAVAIVMIGRQFFRVEIDLVGNEVSSWTESTGQGMLTGIDMRTAGRIAQADPRFVDAMDSRGITDLDLLRCTGLASGNFGSAAEQIQRNFKVTCSIRESEGTLTGADTSMVNSFYVPIAGVVVTVDVLSETVIDFVDTGIVPLPQDPWGHSEEEILARFGKRGNEAQPALMSQADGVGYEIDGSNVSWDIWRFRFSVDDRPGVMINNVEVRDGDTWRSVLYEMYLSEVFVPYSDPNEGWYWRTYMDGGEYGFGDAMTTLTRGVDCPEHATYLTTPSPNIDGTVEEREATVCIFERTNGDPIWRRLGNGRPATDLVVRYAAAVGNYDYLMDYVFKQDGSMKTMVAATGIDAVKAVKATDMESPTAAEDTRFGTLIRPNIVAANHSHFFNFRIDFDIDGEQNSFMKAKMVPTTVVEDVPRKSIWTVQKEVPQREKAAVTKIHTATPAYLAIFNPNVRNDLKQNPGYVLLPGGSVAHSLLDVEDMPVKRNDYVDNQYWVTPYDARERYAGGEFTVQSDGSDTLGKWVNEDRSIANTDIVSWYTVGFHHIPRSEDWPVMPSHWVGFTLAPFNFFDHNPSMTVSP